MTEDLPRYPIIKSRRLTVLIFFGLIILGLIRHTLVEASGAADTGSLRWISAGCITFAFVVYGLLATREPLGRVFANGPPGARIAYGIVAIVAGYGVLFAMFSNIQI